MPLFVIFSFGCCWEVACGDFYGGALVEVALGWGACTCVIYARSIN